LRLLLDTNALFWWLIEEARLSAPAYDAIKARDDEVFVSVASAWEMAIKGWHRQMARGSSPLGDFEGLIQAESFRLLPLSVAHVRDAGLMQAPHRDPFDRLLAAQSMRDVSRLPVQWR
jgi:PIN domain nuclease of toxin-antitoxin system